MNEKTLKYAGSSAVNYLIRHIRPDGSFVYQQKAISDKVSSRYNMLRHSGTLFELCEWFELFPDENQFSALQTPFDFLKGHLIDWDEHLCVLERGAVKLGGAALALLAFAAYYKHTKQDNLIPVMERLAGFLLALQNPDGEFRSKYYLKDRILSDFSSAYYPGQAILALTYLYEIQPNPKWIAAAKKGASFLANKPPLTGEKRANSRIFETWLSKGLWQLLKSEYEVGYAAKLNDILDLNLGILNRSQEETGPGKIGIKAFTSATMATLCEALVSGLRYAVLTNNLEEAHRLRKAIFVGLTFCLNFQIKEGQAKYRPALIGGIRRNGTDSTVRIDFVQHVLSVIIAILSLQGSLTNADYLLQGGKNLIATHVS